MQPMFVVMDGEWMLQLGFWAGAAILGLMLLQGLVDLGAGLRRASFERRRQALERERLEQEIQAAVARRREVEDLKLSWNGFRKFVVQRKEKECDHVYSFYLAPHDRKPLPPFKPGQYLTFQLRIPGQDKAVVRCYSLSDSPKHSDYYRVTIKKVLPVRDQPESRGGVASSYFADVVAEGDVLDVKAPSGRFYLELERERAVVLVAGGVGITPVLSMLNTLAETGDKREVHLFFGVRNGADHIQKRHLEQVAAHFEPLQLHTCYSAPRSEDRLGTDYHVAGRVSVELFKRVLPSSNYEFLMCGPAAFMETIAEDLKVWGVPESDIHFEAFGPATVKKVAPVPASDSGAPAGVRVTFRRSKSTHAWDPAAGSLLEFAEACGVKIDSGCRAGNCGSCLVAVKSGAVEYMSGHGAPAEENSCLACIAKPRTDLEIEA